MTDKLSDRDREKSVLLARLVGWKFSKHECGEPRWSWEDENGNQISGSLHDSVVRVAKQPAIRVAPMLYSPANMALAWRVLNWANDNGLPADQWIAFNEWWKHESYDDDNHRLLWGRPDAQRAWLDKVLDLAIEAGLVEVEP